MRRLLTLVLALSLSPLALGQQEMLEFARADIRSGKMGMIASAMQLTPAQQEVFWPLYRQYADEQEQLLDQRIAMLQAFAASYENITESAAVSIAEQSFAIQRAQTDQRERYFQKMSGILGPVLAARFIQVDSQISTLMDFELMRSTPLIQPPRQDAEEEVSK